MRNVTSCDNCGSRRWRLYGAVARERILHPVQCLCFDCGLIFTSPRAVEGELKDFYTRYYSDWAPEHFDAGHEMKRWAGIRRDMKEIVRFRSSGRLLEVGSGTGIFLKAAEEAGFEAVGVELCGDAVRYARRTYGLEAVYEGTVEEADLEEGSFDVLYAWHVIEHVPDLDRFVRRLHRLLKPGGLLFVGTESHDHFMNRLSRFANLARFRAPATVTSSDHTMVFHPKSLADCLKRRGFRVVEMKAYDELSAAERFRQKGSATRWKAALLSVLSLVARVVDRVTGAGPYLRVAAIRC